MMNFNPFSFDGRLGRLPFMLSIVALLACLSSMLGFALTAQSPDAIASVASAVMLVASVPLLYAIAATCAKRCRDAAMPTWLAALAFVPAVGVAFVLYCSLRGSRENG
ncbi:MAG: hypothetical protein ACFWTZ_00840 [Burkholderia sp.]|jgi:uncharacterized membrane protein YhaH (DUF805 family)